MGMRFAACLMAGAAMLATAAAWAQNAPPPASGDVASNGEEVVVTARKREERLKDVPVAVTAVTAAVLDRQQILQVKDIAAFAPGLTINSDAVGRAFISIRGIGTTLIDTVQPGVGIFIDGIYQPNTSYLNSPILDVERIEVLKGPQGTLFGNNTLGGAINVVTRQPTDEFSGRFTAAYAGPDDYQTYAGSISGPIIEGVLRGRIAASYHTQDGFGKNQLAGGDAHPLEQRTANGSLVWDASSDATFTLNAYYERVRGSQTAYGDLTGPKDYTDDITLNLNSIAIYQYWGANLKGVFDLESINTKVTAVAAYDNKLGWASGDGDFGPVDFIRVSDGHNATHTTTGELRFDTRWSDKVTTLIGLFADQSNVSNHNINNVVPFGIASLASQTGQLAAQAIYGNIFWQITDTIELSAGLRYDHQTVSATDLVTGFHSKYAANELEPRLTLSQHWSPNNMTYASVSRGFRGGGANGPGAPNPIYKGDSVWTYELGEKFTTDDHSFSVDAAIYYNDYRDYIGQNSLAPCTCGVSFVAINLNSGDVESYGLDLEATWKPTDRVTLQGGLTLNHSRITNGSEYEDTTGFPLPSDRILFLPDWNFYVTGSYDLPVGASDDLRFDATLVGKGDRVGSSLSSTFVPVLDPYYLVNANISWIHGDVTVALFATNLFNERYFESHLDSSLLSRAGFPPALANNLGILGDRRRVGLKATVSF